MTIEYQKVSPENILDTSKIILSETTENKDDKENQHPDIDEIIVKIKQQDPDEEEPSVVISNDGALPNPQETNAEEIFHFDAETS